jgi:hypothetical protein
MALLALRVAKSGWAGSQVYIYIYMYEVNEEAKKEKRARERWSGYEDEWMEYVWVRNAPPIHCIIQSIL